MANLPSDTAGLRAFVALVTMDGILFASDYHLTSLPFVPLLCLLYTPLAFAPAHPPFGPQQLFFAY